MPMQDPRSAGSMSGHVVVSGGNKRSLKYLHGTPGHHPTTAGLGDNAPQYVRGNSGKNKSPSLFDNSNNTHFLEMSGNLGSHFGAIGGPGQVVTENQQMSEMPINDFNERLSTGGLNTRA